MAGSHHATSELERRVLGSLNRLVLGRHRLIIGIGLVVGLLCVLLAKRLELHTSLSELLPSDDPGVVALQKTQKRMGDLSLLLVGVHAQDNPKAAENYAALLTDKIRALPPSVCALATYNVRDVRDFFEAHKWLYLSEDDLGEIRDQIRREISKRKNPLYVDLGDDEKPEDLQARVKSKADQFTTRFPDGLLASQDKTFVWVAALPPGGVFAEHSGEALIAAVDRIVKENPPSTFHPGMQVQLGGPVASALESRRAVERDIFWVTVTCSVVVALSIGLYFRRLRAVPLIGIPAVLGTLVAFAVAELAFGYLNSSTAFLGSIILGNGINYAIVLMSRYEEERSRGLSAADAVGLALAGTWRGTGVAALAASAAYASLMITSFRGFYQFGVMASAGAIACWLETYTVLPALLVLLDRKARASAKQPVHLERTARLIGRFAGPIFVALAVVTAVGLAGASHFLGDPFEYDFRKLNVNLTPTPTAKQFTQHVDDIFGRWPSPTPIIADDINELGLIRDAIRKQDQEYTDKHRGGHRTIGDIATVYDLLPGDPETQQRKLGIIAQIRKLTSDPALAVLTDEEKDKLAKATPPANVQALKPEDLPRIARLPFTEADGSIGRVILVYPVEHNLSVWNGHDLLDLAEVLQHLKLANGKTVDTSGSAVVFAAMIRSILHDGPLATVAALVAVLLIILLIMHPLRMGLLAIVTLLVGVSWMVGGAGWAGVRVTFLNFIALPITFGIGAEYALNVVSRYREDRDILKAVSTTGGAVALCSWTTVVGYGSLLAASNRALKGFGAMAILGEIACLTAAILALPAALRWAARRRDRSAQSGRSAAAE